MRRANLALRNALTLLLSGLFGLLVTQAAWAQTIDISLNVFYSNPSSVNSGGTWEVVGKSSHSGISGVSLRLSNIATAERAAPLGTVNGSDPAGFSQFFNTLNPLGFRNVTTLQTPIPPGGVGIGEEQNVFYGVGTLINGAPNFAMKPPGTNSIGPVFTSLTVPAMNSGIPWAVADAFGDAAWATAARLATGTFAAGVTPSFFQNAEITSTGNVFTNLPVSSTTYGTIAEAVLTTIVRTNFGGSSSLPDYNDNGFVDAADYVLWRNLQGQAGPNLPADGNSDGIVNQADYDLWRAHFGAVVTPGSGAAISSATTIPEPASCILLVIGAVFFVGRRRRSS